MKFEHNWIYKNLINSQWQNLVNEMCRMGKITMRIRNQVHIFLERWEQIGISTEHKTSIMAFFYQMKLNCPRLKFLNVI